MAKYEKELYDLGQVQTAFRSNLSTLSEKKQQEAFSLFNVGSSYYHGYFKQAKETNDQIEKSNARIEKINIQNKKINDQTKKINEKQTPWSIYLIEDKAVNANNFQQRLSEIEIQEVIGFYNWLSNLPENQEPEREEEKKEKEDEEKEEDKKTNEEVKTTTPTKEDSSVPSELETLVAQYKLAQAETLEADSLHTVADAVKRARNTWETRNRANLIRENRLAKIEEVSERDKQREIEGLSRDLFLVEKVDPKTRMANLIYRDIDNLSRKAVIAQAASLGIKDLTEAQISKATKDLSYLGLTGAIDITNYNDLNIASQLALKNQGISIQSVIKEVDDIVQDREKALKDEAFSNKPEELEVKIALADQKAKEKLKESTNAFSTEIKKNLDLDDDFRGAIRTVKKVQENLSKAIPKASLHFEEKPDLLQQNAIAIESALRSAMPNKIRINTEVVGAQTIGMVMEVHGKTRELNPEAIRFLSLGLTTKEFNILIQNSSKESAIGKLFKNPDGSFNELHTQFVFQLDKAEQSKLGREIAAKLKPLTDLSRNITALYNNATTPLARNAIKFALNPVGTLRSWAATQAGRQIGKRLIERTGSALAQKLGGYLMKEGLENGVKVFAAEAAKKLALKVVTWAAVKLGVSISAESLNAIMPGLGVIVDILLQIGIVIFEKTVGAAFGQVKDLYREMTGEEFTWRGALAPIGVAGAAAIGIGMAISSGFFFIARTFQLAVISMVATIWLSVITVGLYLGFAYLVAPIISTLVQFDSLERVDYSAATPIDNTPIAPGCPSAWPIKVRAPVLQGPGGKASHSHPPYDQALDIAVVYGTPVYSTSDGVVEMAGLSAVYLNTNIVTVNSKLPNGTAFQVLYAHLSYVKVHEGQSVKVGDFIGNSGTAGTGPHLHYEYKNIRYNLCPAGGIKMADNCAADAHPGAGGVCVPDDQPYLYSN